MQRTSSDLKLNPHVYPHSFGPMLGELALHCQCLGAHAIVSYGVPGVRFAV